MTNGPDNLARTVLTDPVHFLAFGFGTGLAPFAPGTFGSIPGVILFWLTLDSGLYVQLGIAGAMAIMGIWICGESARRIGVHDHGGIVWDEIVGMYVTLLVAPVTVLGFVLAFVLFRVMDIVLFRVMDIVKPWPIRDLDPRLRGGLGIMPDDLAAALYAALLLVLYGWLMT
jgi:phosphatidylglycerophosphatase A